MHYVNSVGGLASVVKGRRLDLGLSQKLLAQRAGVSREWINQFESGKPTAQLAQLLRVIDALELSLAVDERPPSELRRAELDEVVRRHSCQ